MRDKKILFLIALAGLTSDIAFAQEDTPVKAVFCMRPDYPKKSLIEKEEGIVDILFQVNEKGKITGKQIHKSSGFERLDEATRKDLRCKFKPEIKNGKAIASSTTLSFHWKLPPE